MREAAGFRGASGLQHHLASGGTTVSYDNNKSTEMEKATFRAEREAPFCFGSSE